MYTKLPNGKIVYAEDISCVLDAVGGKGGIFISNLEAAQNPRTLQSIFLLYFRAWNKSCPYCF
jgi:hypothetical protein